MTAGPDATPAVGRDRARRRPQWLQLVWLTAAWCLLWGGLSWANVLGGAVLAAAVSWLFPMPAISTRGLRVRPVAAAVLVVRFAGELVAASAEVSWLVGRRRAPGLSSIIAVPLRTGSDVLLLLTCQMLSLVPGSLVVETSRARRVIFVHVLAAGDRTRADDARRRIRDLEARVIRAFGPVDEVEALRAEGSDAR